MKFPISIKVEVHVTDGDGSDGQATYVHGWGKIPTEEEMKNIVSSVVGKIPEGFRIMTADESAMHYLREERGYQGEDLAIVGMLDEGEEFFQPE